MRHLDTLLGFLFAFAGFVYFSLCFLYPVKIIRFQSRVFGIGSLLRPRNDWFFIAFNVLGGVVGALFTALVASLLMLSIVHTGLR
jgi:hypothetical protein